MEAIERLTRERDALKFEAGEAETHIERLTRERDEHKHDSEHTKGILRSAERDYKARIARLQAALERIADPSAWTVQERTGLNFAKYARAALSGEPESPSETKREPVTIANATVTWPGGKPESPATLVLRICSAYEHGFGQAPRDLTNPYLPLTPESEAWNIGWQEGKKRNAEKAKERLPLKFANQAELARAREVVSNVVVPPAAPKEEI